MHTVSTYFDKVKKISPSR